MPVELAGLVRTPIDYGRDLIPIVREEVARREPGRDAVAGQPLTQTR